MTTCAQIAAQIGVANVNFAYDWIEHVGETLYSENPIPRLDVRNMAADEFSSQHANYDVNGNTGTITFNDSNQ